MAAQSTYLDNKLIDHANGVTSYTMPTVYVALIQATAPNNGQSPRSTAVTSGQTAVPATPNGHLYRCTTSGTTGAGEPTWPTTSGGTVTDGTAVWTEMTPDFQANNSSITANEANYTGYVRKALSGLMGAASSGSATNTSAITFAACTAGTNAIGAWVTYDASTVGNALRFAALPSGSSVLVITSAVSPIQFAASGLTTSMS